MPELPTNPTAAAVANDIAAARLVRRTLRQWPLIIGFAVVGLVAIYLASSSRTKQYEAVTTVQLSQVDLASVFVGQNLQQQGQDATALTATNAELVTQPDVREATSRLLGGKVSTADLEGAISVTPSTGTTLVKITAKDSDPALAAKIADATRQAFINVRRDASVAQFDQAYTRVQAQLAQIPSDQRGSAAAVLLRDRLQQIDTLRSVSTGGVQTVQTARVPTAATSPRPKRDGALGLIAGLLFGTGLALLRARIDDRVRDTDELAELWGLPVVGLIPETDGLKHSGVTIPDGPALEALSLARTNLRYLNVGGKVKTVILTSALEGEGKSTITWNLGLAAGLAKSRVLVVEADLRRPMITSRLGIAVKSGLSEILAGMATAEEAIVPVTVSDDARGVSVTVDVLPAGLAPPSPITLLESSTMIELLAELRSTYDVVLIDTPPATIVADAVAFMDHVDGVIVVSRLGRLRRGALLRLKNLLDRIDAPVLGQVVNSGASSKAYGYTSYTRAKSPAASTPGPTGAGRTQVEQS